MTKPLTKIIVIVLILVFSRVSGCKKNDSIGEADVLGIWEVMSWNSDDFRFNGCDMLGTLTFSRDEWGVKVIFNFTCDGVPQNLPGHTSLGSLPRIGFEVNGFKGSNIVFEGFVEDGRMLGRLGQNWSGCTFYSDDEWWEAVKK